jgi:hypothetical protein
MKKGQTNPAGLIFMILGTAVIVIVGVTIILKLIPTDELSNADASLKQVSFAIRMVGDGQCRSAEINIPSGYKISQSNDELRLLDDDDNILKSLDRYEKLRAPKSKDSKNFLNSKENPLEINHDYSKKIKGELCVCKLTRDQTKGSYSSYNSGDIVIIPADVRLGISECIL